MSRRRGVAALALCAAHRQITRVARASASRINQAAGISIGCRTHIRRKHGIAAWWRWRCTPCLATSFSCSYNINNLARSTVAISGGRWAASAQRVHEPPIRLSGVCVAARRRAPRCGTNARRRRVNQRAVCARRHRRRKQRARRRGHRVAQASQARPSFAGYQRATPVPQAYLARHGDAHIARRILLFAASAHRTMRQQRTRRFAAANALSLRASRGLV